MEWIELYHDKKKKPGINELKEYFSVDIMSLFSEFSNYLSSEYNLNCSTAIYTNAYGWTFRFGRSNMYLISGVRIANGSFYIEEIQVNSKNSLNSAISLADKLYANGFKERYELYSAQKNAKQAERTKKRIEREKKEIEDMAAIIHKDKFNKFRWSPKLSRQTLIKLYKSDARMVLDEDLVDDVGYTLYARCLQGRDERILIESDKMKCHNCGNILTNKKGLIECECGNQYLFRDYMRSFRINNMPTGGAAHIFNHFIDEWAKTSKYHDKMKLIDDVIHEFHINLMSGVKGRFVGINLIEGTKKQIGELIFSLAYK